MVIFDDLHKLLLYQKLNLGFECNVCKRKFYNRLDHLQHTSSCKNEFIKCQKCGKMFGHQQILHLHMQFHNLSESSSSAAPEVKKSSFEVKPDCVELIDSDDDEKQTSQVNIEYKTKNLPTDEVTKDLRVCQKTSDLFQALQNKNETEDGSSSLSAPIKILQTPKKPSRHVAKAKPKSAKKMIGLTKVKMEDCLRCDACSCIYIDEKDYYKHMRNFHQLDMNNSPIPQRKVKKKCRSCCKQCRGVHCTPIKRPRATQRASNLIFKINMRDNIKDRWSRMVSQQLSETPVPSPSELVEVKPDPDVVSIKTEPDLSHLLAQVEVNIKTEPADDYL